MKSPSAGFHSAIRVCFVVMQGFRAFSQFSVVNLPSFPRGMGMRLLVALFVLAPLPVVRAALMVLTAPSGAHAMGSSVQVELLLVNEDIQPVYYALPVDLDGRLIGSAESWTVALHGRNGDVTVPARGFVRVPLVFALPPGASGRLVLEVNQPSHARAVIEVGAKPSGFGRRTPPDESPAAGSLRAASRLKYYYSDHFSAHEPMYLVFGGGKPAAKFQLSFKYRLLNDQGPLTRRLPPLRGLHLGYTQRSLWDLSSDSSPFYDTSYIPEVLFESLAADKGSHTGFTWLGYQTGLQHESNGKGGADSRSLNTLYARSMFLFGNPDGWRLILMPKVFTYLGVSSDNAHVKEYRGYSELRAIFGKNNRLSVSATGRLGEDFDKGSLQIDVTYPTEFLTGNFALYLLAQYWTGYGESLLRYDRSTTTTRFGISLAR